VLLLNRMQYIFGIIIFLFGAALGSFVSVIANRYNTGLSFLKGRSVCFSCNTQLQNKDLVPIFSFLSLKGKCRYCQSKISKETIIVELLMGVLSVLAALKSGLFSLRLGAWSLESEISYLLITIIFAVILLISVYDLKHFIIPDSFLVSFFIFSLIYLFIFNFPILHTSYFILQNLLSGLVLALPFFLIFIISKGTWFGFGDVKYILALGFLLGFIQGLSAVVLSFWIGAAFSIIILVFKKIVPSMNLPLLKNNLTIKSEIPFGPFLSLGVIISFCLSLDLFQIHELFNIF
jgi:prepilin signal peptidase PulO-like enzyme (type II secretory pathway)